MITSGENSSADSCTAGSSSLWEDDKAIGSLGAFISHWVINLGVEACFNTIAGLTTGCNTGVFLYAADVITEIIGNTIGGLTTGVITGFILNAISAIANGFSGGFGVLGNILG
jgi:hypothetical protein